MTVRCGPRRSIAGKQAGIVGDGKGQGAAGGGVPTTSSTPGALPGKVEDSGACLGGGVEQGRVWGSGRNGSEPWFSGSLSLEPPRDSASVSYSCQVEIKPTSSDPKESSVSFKCQVQMKGSERGKPFSSPPEAPLPTTDPEREICKGQMKDCRL